MNLTMVSYAQYADIMAKPLLAVGFMNPCLGPKIAKLGLDSLKKSQMKKTNERVIFEFCVFLCFALEFFVLKLNGWLFKPLTDARPLALS